MREQGASEQGSEGAGPGRTDGQLWSRWSGPVIILAAAALAIAPQLIRGNSCGHDFDVHLVSWLDCVNAWRHGIPYPHWTPSANYGAGEPRFVFYPPLTWMLGAVLGFIFPWSFVPIAFTFLTLAGTGLATRALALEALDDLPATLAGCVAIFSGFTLFTGYERSAFPEFAGGVWLPLLLLFALRDRHPGGTLIRRAFDGSTAPLAIALAGLALESSARRDRQLSAGGRRAGCGSQRNPGLRFCAPLLPRRSGLGSRLFTGSPLPWSATGSTSARLPRIPATTSKTTGSSLTTPIRCSPCTTQSIARLRGLRSR